MRRRQPAPAPAPEIDEYAEVRIPFDDVLRKLTNVQPAKKQSANKAPPKKKA